ncbi:MAG: hypothetical protein CME70_02570 [Halobacteriovorax sp.]|nr:hypothetical protein [Halobacteriovorax sp.]|tara:strand:- start:7159 stop:8496 length:1338 start_codon:yes stop_codon:yes gene_type:complete
MRFHFKILISLSFVLSSSLVWAESVPKKFSLELAEQLALEMSPDSRLADSYIHSLEQKVRSVDANNYPKIVLEGSYKYIETVPELSTQAGVVSLGDNQNYSIGPAIIFNLFDGGVVRNTVKSLKELKESKISEKLYVESMVRFAVRLAYLNVLISGEQYHLAQESYNLSKVQNQDIKRKRKLGALSQLDLSLSNGEFLNQKLKLLDAKKVLKKSIIDLSVLVSKNSQESILYVPREFSFVSGSLVQFDSLDQIIQILEKSLLVSSGRPAQVMALERKIESVEKEVKAESSKYWPQVSLKIKSSLDYPNGPKIEEIHQNSIGLNLTMPLYDWGERSGAKAEKRAQIEGLKARKWKLERDINKDITKVKLELQSLKEQEPLIDDLVLEVIKVAKINLSTFKSGKIEFTEVERANVKKFEAQVRRLILKGQIFSKLSQIDALSQGGLK